MFFGGSKLYTIFDFSITNKTAVAISSEAASRVILWLPLHHGRPQRRKTQQCVHQQSRDHGRCSGWSRRPARTEIWHQRGKRSALSLPLPWLWLSCIFKVSNEAKSSTQHRPESPTNLTLTKYASKYNVRKLHQRYILKKGCPHSQCWSIVNDWLDMYMTKTVFEHEHLENV